MKELSISDLKNIDRNYITVDDVVHVHVNGVTFKMIKVSGRTFKKGLTLSDYWIGETAVTQELWKAVMGKDVRDYDSGRGNNFPVYYVGWNNIRGTGGFLEKLNAALSSELGGMQFALPSEAQWWFAARGGNNSHDYEYAGSNNIEDVAWYWKNSGDQTHPVGQKQPNELGLYDMSGNVWEWCDNNFDDDAHFPFEYFAFRGGSYCDHEYDSRIWTSVYGAGGGCNVGFRLVLLP